MADASYWGRELLVIFFLGIFFMITSAVAFSTIRKLNQPDSEDCRKCLKENCSAITPNSVFAMYQASLGAVISSVILVAGSGFWMLKVWNEKRRG